MKINPLLVLLVLYLLAKNKSAPAAPPKLGPPYG